jgi:hypothetical protein
MRSRSSRRKAGMFNRHAFGGSGYVEMNNKMINEFEKLRKKRSCPELL